MTLSLARPQAAFLAAACALCVSTLPAVSPAGATALPAKDSPYAAATDGGSPAPAAAEPGAVPGTMAGSVPPGTEKESPYAAAKDELGLSFGPNLGKLWWLLLPAGLAAGSYLYLRSQEGASS